MQIKDVLKLLIVGFLAPLLWQLSNNYIPNFGINIEMISQVLLWILGAVYTFFKSRTYRRTYVQKKNLEKYKN